MARAGGIQWRNDPDRPFRNIRKNTPGSRNNNRKPRDGCKPGSAGPMPPRRWAMLPWRAPTDEALRCRYSGRGILSAGSPPLGDDRRDGTGATRRHACLARRGSEGRARRLTCARSTCGTHVAPGWVHVLLPASLTAPAAQVRRAARLWGRSCMIPGGTSPVLASGRKA
jgi:hypothetical protein